MSDTSAYRYKPSFELRIAKGLLTGLMAVWLAIGIVVATHLTIWGVVLVPVTGAAMVAAREIVDRLEERQFDRTWIVALGAEGSFSERELQRLGIIRSEEEEAPRPCAGAGSVVLADRGGQGSAAPVSERQSDAVAEGSHVDE